MRVLTFLVDRFAWEPFSRTLDDALEDPPAGEVGAAVVVFAHVEPVDVSEERRAKVFKKVLKHVKWLANKRELDTIVLHSFTHLGAENAPADEALRLLEEIAERLRATDYSVALTPFGWFSRWSIDVRGESLAKVYKTFA